MKSTNTFITALTFLLLGSSSFSFADSKGYRILKHRSPDPRVSITYPQLRRTDDVGDRVNYRIRVTMRAWAELGRESGVNIDSVIDSLTPKYFAFTAHGESDGGAHPSTWNDSHIYSLKTGNELSVERAMGIKLRDQPTDADFKKYEAAHAALTKILAQHIPDAMKEGEGACYGPKASTESGMSDEDLIGMSEFTATIRDGKILITVNPPHVMAACGFDVALTVSELDSVLMKGAIFRSWLR